MRDLRARIPFLLILLTATPAGAQQIVTSARPDRVEVTVYRAPHRAADQPFELEWLQGYALISETRRIQLPAGESEIRFEGVAGGILPQSAIVRGFPQGIVERNRDALLLGPDSLLDRSLGRRVHLRRTSRATGAVRELDAVVRSGADGAVVLQTAEGFEALRCSGDNETLIYDQVPAGLSARPTLSVRARSSAPVTATVTLSYLADGFDWQANYIATLAPDGRHIELFAWVTLANGDETSFANADTQTVAGRLNRAAIEDDGNHHPGIRRVAMEDDGAFYEDDDDADAHELRLQCWPYGTTGWPGALPPAESEEIRLGGRLGSVNEDTRASFMIEDQDVIVTANRAVQENLGDLKLYRIPEPVTVAARSQKQVAFLQQPRVSVDTVYRVRMSAESDDHADTARRFLVTRNRTVEGLGMPLPGGTVQLFAAAAGGRPILLGEGGVRDYAVGENVEIQLGDAPGIATGLEWQDEVNQPSNVDTYRVTVTNDRPEAIQYELELQVDEGDELRPQGARLTRRNGMPLWRVTVPAHGSATLRYRVIERDNS